METLTSSTSTNLPENWGNRSKTFSNHGFEYYDIAVKGGEIRSQHPLPVVGEATLEQVLRNNRSFLQIFGRNGAESDQVATLSFGLSGGVETIDALAANITQGLGKVEVRSYGVGSIKNQINIFVESDDLDPMFLLGKMIDAPKEVYANIQGLKVQVKAQEWRRQTLLAPGGKGRFFEDIFYTRVDGDVRPLEKVDGSAEFAWAYYVRGNELLNQEQSMTSLALDYRVDLGMRDSLLDAQKYMAETPKGKSRFVFRVDGHPTTEECCPRATNVQMGDTNRGTTDQFYGSAISIMASGGIERSNTCSICQKDKNTSNESRRCHCSENSPN
jgi:hypothetical protein